MGSKRVTPGDALTRWARLQPPPAPTATPERRDRLVATIASAMGRGVASRERASVRTRTLGVVGAAAAALVLALGPAFAYMSWRDRARSPAQEVHHRVEPALGNATPSRLPPAAGASAGASSPIPSNPPAISEQAPGAGASLPRGIEHRNSRTRGASGGAVAHSPALPEKSTALDSTVDDPSDLGEQNRLFASAMRARERGDDRGSARLLDELIRKYPASPLLQEAYVSRFRALLSAGERAEAALAARRYLFAWPDGYAAQEAQEIAAEKAARGRSAPP